jgi:hypothetical protein
MCPDVDPDVDAGVGRLPFVIFCECSINNCRRIENEMIASSVGAALGHVPVQLYLATSTRYVSRYVCVLVRT